MAPKRKTKAAGKSKVQDQILDKPAFKRTARKSAPASRNVVEAMLGQRTSPTSEHTTGVGEAGPSNDNHGSPNTGLGEAGPSNVHHASRAVDRAPAIMLQDDNATETHQLEAILIQMRALSDSNRVMEKMLQRVENTVDTADAKAGRVDEHCRRVEPLIAAIEAAGAHQETVWRNGQVVDQIKENVDEIKDAVVDVSQMSMSNNVIEIKVTVDETKEAVDETKTTVRRMQESVAEVRNAVDSYRTDTNARLDILKDGVVRILQILQQRLPPSRYN